MERLPPELSLRIFCLLDHRNLATAQLVCRKWKIMGSDNSLWCDLFIERWGLDQATFYAPSDSKTWKHVYMVQDRCDRNGLGLKIIREGDDYYLIHQGEIQRHLGSRISKMENISDSLANYKDDKEEPNLGILDKILFFIGDFEAASAQAKRSRLG
ncbi:PREDICTED: uncharacterized protein LOC109215221 [Nicotiana attenuata]|uniref:F-box protein n=1 Tax=Nicotiana attenuata TaxID=49451 RepID=A0A1J6KAT6_NICAT|nr:PREDICTED: uncharacterized protein LOC109215221 [Nicotiana attenuata]OIT26502.1 hypothetical protein A4A49_31292 [Nicotiana attenuata]